MRGSGVIGFCLSTLAGAAAVQAAPPNGRAPTRIEATLDSSGKVLPIHVRPIEAAKADMDVIGAPRITPCSAATDLSPDQARALVLRIATEENFYPEFVLSVSKIESRYVSTALSGKGAYGLMQLTLDTARRFKVDRCAPADNVRGGIRYLRLLHDRYKNPFFILAAYNAGEQAVLNSRGVPPYPETVRFVADVMNDFYTWPVPGPVGTRASASKAVVSGTSDLIETAPATAPPSALAAPGSKPPLTEQWSDGFVMHVE